MNWNTLFSSSIGKKLQMGLTGIFLILFLLVHCYINAQIFWNDGGQKFNEAAHFMANNPLIRISELGLFAFLILHTIQGLSLYFKNKSRRTQAYKVSAGNATSKWFSRSMAILGTLILLFLVMHLNHFWVPSRITGLETYNFNGVEYHNLYAKMQLQFKDAMVVAIYTLGCISLAWHLLHGFYSAFQTLGLASFKYKALIKSVGIVFSILIPLLFASMPIAFFLDLIK